MLQIISESDIFLFLSVHKADYPPPQSDFG